MHWRARTCARSFVVVPMSVTGDCSSLASDLTSIAGLKPHRILVCLKLFLDFIVVFVILLMVFPFLLGEEHVSFLPFPCYLPASDSLCPWNPFCSSGNPPTLCSRLHVLIPSHLDEKKCLILPFLFLGVYSCLSFLLTFLAFTLS